MKKRLKEAIEKELKNVIDPELGISIVDLGLIYEVQIKKEGAVKVVMTLTTPGCPLSGYIAEKTRDSLLKLGGVKKVDVKFTFDPPWNEEMMSEEAKIQLGII